jgi:hypothetical protein
MEIADCMEKWLHSRAMKFWRLVWRYPSTILHKAGMRLIQKSVEASLDRFTNHDVTVQIDLDKTLGSSTYVLTNFLTEVDPMFASLTTEHAQPGILVFARVSANHVHDIALRCFRWGGKHSFVAFKN